MNLSPNDFNSANLLAELRSLLAEELGTFTNNRAAIWVEPPEPPGAGTGVHVYIDRTPYRITLKGVYSVCISVVLHGNRQQNPVEYEYNLQKFDRAIKRLRWRYPRHREVPIPGGGDIPPQFKFYLLLEEADALSVSI